MTVLFLVQLTFNTLQPTLQQLESVWWTEDGEHILSSHSDGSYCRWIVGEGDVSEDEKSDIPYGEDIWLSSTCVFVLFPSRCGISEGNSVFSCTGHFPCKAISKIVQLPTEKGWAQYLLSLGFIMFNFISQMCHLIICYILIFEYTELNLTLCVHIGPLSCCSVGACLEPAMGIDTV